MFKINLQLGLLLSLVLCYILSMGVNNTPVLVLLIPIFVTLAARGAMPASKTLMPLNAMSLLGGLATTIGTSTNILVVSIASDLGMERMGVFHFTPIVLAASLIALPYIWLVMPRMLRDNNPDEIQASRRFFSRIRVPPDSDLVGREVNDVMKRMPEDFRFEQRPAGAFAAGQRLRVSGTHEALESAIRVLKGQFAPAWVIDAMEREASARHEDLRVVEMVVTADSRLIGRTLPTSGIADQHGVAVLGIHRPKLLLRPEGRAPRGEIRFAEGDVLLVMGLRDAIQAFAQADSLLQLEGAREIPRRSKAWLAAGIMLGSVGMASIGLVPIAIAALAGAILMFLTGCVKFDRVGRALSAQVIVLVAASIAIGRVIADSGAAAWLGETLALGLGYLPPAGVLAAIMLFVTVLTNFASNATAATVGTPIAFAIATQLGLPQEPLILAVLFGCNLCYATPIAYQTNMLIMAEGDYNFGDYLRTGVPLVILMVATLSFLLVVTYEM